MLHTNIADTYYAECCYAECHYAQSCYAECRGPDFILITNLKFL